jgi:hypothetical protein
MLPVIGIEPIGIHRVAGPNPPQRYENQDEFPELEWVKMTLARVAQDMRYVSDRHRKNQVEERLEPSGMAIGLEILYVVHIASLSCLRRGHIRGLCRDKNGRTYGRLSFLPLYDGIARMKSHAHWQTDVLGGWALGTAVGYLTTTWETPVSVMILPHGLAIGLSKRF